jgi:hypothetical protein
MIATQSTPTLQGHALRRATRWLVALRNWGSAARRRRAFAHVKALAMSLGPYALIELILPGGSVMALLLWLYRRRKNAASSGSLVKDMLPAHITGRASAVQA